MATYLTMPADLPSYAEGFKPDDTVEHQILSTAQHWLSSFEHAALNGDGDAFASLFAKNGFWRDIIAFTNDYRSIRTANIAKAANVSLPRRSLRSALTIRLGSRLLKPAISLLPLPSRLCNTLSQT